MSRLPRYAIVGLLVILVSEAAMLLRAEPFWSWHTPIAWTGYILFIDGLVRKRRGHSWLTTAFPEFLFLAAVSIPLWAIFEGYNLLIRNWQYVNLPERVFWRSFGYAWSFATIWPAIFETGELMATIGKPSADTGSGPSRTEGAQPVAGEQSWRLGTISMAIGALMLAWPLVWPSPYLAALVWLGFIFLLDPLNARLGGESLIADRPRRRARRALNLALAGSLCGLLWEFWNYWARAKWIYTVPFMERAKLFEMPLPGYLGFPTFALECFTMYVFVRRLLWRGPARQIAL